ncbi:MAG: uroporphyrinogen-III synthase, partial [Acidimicrobiia bacterium]
MVPGKEAPRHKVLVLRPEDQAADLAALVDHRGLEPVVVPIIRIAPPQEEDLSAIDRLLEEAHEFAWVVLTSANGVAAVVDRARDLGRPLKLGRVAAIGSGTQRRLESRGIRVDWIPSTFTTRAIADELPLVGRQSSTTQESPRVALVRADIADKEMDEALEA